MLRRSSRVAALGLVLIVLGLGNWAMGDSRLRKYQEVMDHALAVEGEAVAKPFRGTLSILEGRGENHHSFAAARLKYDYYRVVHRGGILLLCLGLLMVAGAGLRRMVVPRHPPAGGEGLPASPPLPGA